MNPYEPSDTSATPSRAADYVAGIVLAGLVGWLWWGTIQGPVTKFLLVIVK